jgi:3alpha(or 20beta)-hydroxysteroid dehydrogenase
MAERVKGKVALVTGAAGGLGMAMSKRLLEEGVEGIVLTDLSESKLFDFAKEMEQLHQVKIIPLTQDVTREEDWQQVASVIQQDFGKLDILVNNAGGSRRVTFEEGTLDDWNWVVALNQTSTFLGMKVCLPLLKQSGKASIINISSVAGLTGYHAAAYTASKWAVRGMTKAAAMEFADWGVRVNSVHPGFIRTPLTEPVIELVKKYNKVNAMERIGQPDEIAHAILFLASDESSYMTGSELVLDGGMMAGGAVRMVGKENGVYASPTRATD